MGKYTNNINSEKFTSKVEDKEKENIVNKEEVVVSKTAENNIENKEEIKEVVSTPKPVVKTNSKSKNFKSLHLIRRSR